MHNIRPSEVRAMMLSEIAGLRASLDGLAAAADSDPSRLQACSAEVHARLRTYLEHEDSLLLHALEQTDYWGPNRLAAMQRAHSADWAAAADFARAADRPGADLHLLARRAARLRSDLIRNLEEEERCLLIAEVLQDDVSSHEQSDG